MSGMFSFGVAGMIAPLGDRGVIVMILFRRETADDIISG